MSETKELKVGDEVQHFNQHLEGKIIKIYPDTKECKVEVKIGNYIYFYITPLEQWKKLKSMDSFEKNIGGEK